jgi:hypothetical protein
MTILFGLFTLWGLSSFFTPYLALYCLDTLASIVDITALYCLDTLASIVDITSVSPHDVFDKKQNELIEPTHIFEHIVAHQYILPVLMLLGPFAIIFSFGHIIFSIICFIPYYYYKCNSPLT